MVLNFLCAFTGLTSGLMIGIYLRENGFSSSVRNSFMTFNGFELKKEKPFVKGSTDYLFNYFSEEKTKHIDMEVLFKEQFDKAKHLKANKKI